MFAIYLPSYFQLKLIKFIPEKSNIRLFLKIFRKVKTFIQSGSLGSEIQWK